MRIPIGAGKLVSLKQAIDEAEQKGRDVSAVQMANQRIAYAVEELTKRQLLREIGESTEEYFERISGFVSGLYVMGERNYHKQIMELFDMVVETRRLAEPVATWTGAMNGTTPVMICEEQTCKWDVYRITYSFVLRTSVILAVKRNLTKEQANVFRFKITGGKGQYTELPEVKRLSELEPGQFYFVALVNYTVTGEAFNDADFAHVELVDQKIGREIVRNVKVVRFLKGKRFLGLEDVMNVCRLDQLPTCTFYGPARIEVEEVTVGEVIEEIKE